MEWLLGMLPLGLILFACVGLHFFMMRGMHGAHRAGHEGQSGLGGEDSPDRVAQLENQVAQLQQEIKASRHDSGDAINGSRPERVQPIPRRDDVAARDAGRGCH